MHSTSDAMNAKKRVGILGASGYTGADAVRLLARHPDVAIAALTADTHAGKSMDEVFPHFFMLDLPRLVEWEKVDWRSLDAVFCGLPHGTTQEIIAAVVSANPAIKIKTPAAANAPATNPRLSKSNSISNFCGCPLASLNW